jgi:hypothetical protein
MNHSAGNGSGSDNADFDHQIIKILRLESRQHSHLRPAFDLKNSHGVAFTDHIEDRGIIRRNRCEGILDGSMLS